MHNKAWGFNNDDESEIHSSFKAWLEKLATHAPVGQYRHYVVEDKADAHCKQQVMGLEVVVAVNCVKFDFGSWEQIFYGDFDGR